jgi:molybdenum cofactor guanylyltransferase
MGRDKAALIVDGEPLWQRQLNILRATNPAELLISGPKHGVYAASGVRIVSDRNPGKGPLGGLAAALEACSGDWLLALAVDLPRMRADFLHRLLDEAIAANIGIVPTLGEGKLEPLAAVYPKSALAVAELHLSQGRVKLSEFIREWEGRGAMRTRMVSPEDAALFANWNTPDDLQ